MQTVKRNLIILLPFLLLLLPNLMTANALILWTNNCDPIWSGWTDSYLGASAPQHGNASYDSTHIEGNYSVNLKTLNVVPQHYQIIKTLAHIYNISDMTTYDYWVQFHLYVRQFSIVYSTNNSGYCLWYAPTYAIDDQLWLSLTNQSTGYSLKMGKSLVEGLYPSNNPPRLKCLYASYTSSNITQLNLATWYRIDLHYTSTSVEVFVNGSISMYDNVTRANQKPTTFNIYNLAYPDSGTMEFLTDYVIVSETQEGVPSGGFPPGLQYQLIIATTTGGTTNPAPGNWIYDVNANIAITALPSTGYIFSHWAGMFNSTDNPVHIVMYTNRTETAYFVSSGGLPPPLPPIVPGGSGITGTLDLVGSFFPLLIFAIVPAAMFGKYAGMLGVFLGLLLSMSLMAFLQLIPMWIIYLMAFGLGIFFVNRVRSSGGNNG